MLILKVVSASGSSHSAKVGDGYASPVFLSKSAQAVENKRRERRKKPQESSRVRKRMKARKLRMLLDVVRLEERSE